MRGGDGFSVDEILEDIEFVEDFMLFFRWRCRDLWGMNSGFNISRF